jgi:hypothetical protein
MRRWAWAAVAAALLTGCGERTPPPGAPADEMPPASSAPAAPGADALMEGRTSLFLYDADPGGGQGKPRFEIRDTVVTLDRNNEWSFRDAHAVIYGEDGTETHLFAGEGRLDEASQHARLSGGVRMQIGAPTDAADGAPGSVTSVELEDIEWADGRARSDKPIMLRDGESEITAGSLEYNPDTHELLLTDARGTLRYGEESPEATEADGAPETAPADAPAERSAGQ